MLRGPPGMCTKESLLVVFGGLDGMLGLEVGVDTWKENTLPAGQWLWAPGLDF